MDVLTSETPLETSASIIQVLDMDEQGYVVINQDNRSDQPIEFINEETIISENNDLKSIKEDMNTIKFDLKSIKNDINNLNEKLDAAINNQTVIHEAFKPVLLKITEMQVQFEEFIKKSIKERQNVSFELDFKPISDLKDLEEFENLLTDPEYKEKMQKKFSVLCTKGKGQGVTSAYAIVDRVFERRFFTICSWSGGSRSQGHATEKICFKAFSKTINFFFNIIHQFDTSFSVTDCQKFFKTILRNSIQRCKNSPKRASTKKCRTKQQQNDKTSSVKRVTNKDTDPSSPQQPPMDQEMDVLQGNTDGEDEVLDLK